MERFTGTLKLGRRRVSVTYGSKEKARRCRMLVLSRKAGESIQIDDNIFVTVSEVKGGRVRLSIDAPRSIRIVRQEILERDFPSQTQDLVMDVPVLSSSA